MLRWSLPSLLCHATWEIRERLPKVKLLVQIDDWYRGLLKGAVDYERYSRSRPVGSADTKS